MKNKILLLLVATMLLTSCSLDSRLEKIDSLINDGNYKKAESLLIKELNKDEKNKDLYDILIEVYTKDKKDIKPLLIEGIDRFNDIDYKRHLGDIYIEEKEFLKAIDLYEDIIVKDKETSNYRKLFELHRREGLEKDFLTIFEREIGHIKDEKLLLEVALSYLNFGNEARARQIVEDLDFKDIKDLKTYEFLAEYYFKINDFGESYRIAEEGLSLRKSETILYAYTYGFMNSDGLELKEVYREDINGDGRKENVILLSEGKDILNSGNTILTIQDGSNGDILSKKRLEEYMGYGSIEFLDFNGDGIKDIYLNKYIEKDKDAKPEIYSFIDNDFKLITGEYSYNDIEYSLDKNFKLDIFSEHSKKKEIIDLSKNKDRYIDLGIYSKSGEVLDYSKVEIENSRFAPFYKKTSKHYGVKEVYSLRIDGEVVSQIDLYYLYNGKKMIIDNLYIKSKYNLKSEEYKGERVTIIDSLNKEEIEDIFQMDKESILKKYGNPKKVDYINGEVLDYNGIQFLIKDNKVSSIRVLSSKNIMKMSIPASYDKIIEDLGQPDMEKLGEEYLDEHLIEYSLGKIKLRFSGIKNEEDSFILFIEE